MTNLEANQLVKARRRLKQAQAEYNAAKLRETRYRGVPSVVNIQSTDKELNCTCTYRGVSYTI